MDHASASFTSPWAAAVLSQHAMNPTNIEHGFGHHGLTMDYSYYRCGWIEHNFFVSCSSSPSSSPHLTLSRHHKKNDDNNKASQDWIQKRELNFLCEQKMRYFSRLFTWCASFSVVLQFSSPFLFIISKWKVNNRILHAFGDVFGVSNSSTVEILRQHSSPIIVMMSHSAVSIFKMYLECR